MRKTAQLFNVYRPFQWNDFVERRMMIIRGVNPYNHIVPFQYVFNSGTVER
jgi:hypothetical protein